MSFPPAFNEVLGRAQAFAASHGDGTVTPEHVLLALIWDPRDQASQLLWRLWVSRERLVERLRDEEVPVPRVAIPEQTEVEIGERVWFDRKDTRAVLEHFRKHVPPEGALGLQL